MNDDKKYTWHTPPELWEKLRPLAREKRTDPTPSEDRLWQALRNRRIRSAKFRRQHSIERFIVDFYCAEHAIIIEVDGGIHQSQQVEDDIRQEFLEMQGFRVVRFTNAQIDDELDDVLCYLRELLTRYTREIAPPIR